MGLRDNLQVIAEDLGKSQLGDVLRANRTWDPTISSVIVAEGLLMYLPSTAVKSLLKQCASISGTGSRLAFTYIGTRANDQPDAGPRTGLVLWLLKVSGEPWLWSIRPDELGSFLKKNNWTIAPDQMASSGKFGVEFFDVALK